jgi:hypothetical protein
MGRVGLEFKLDFDNRAGLCQITRMKIVVALVVIYQAAPMSL